MILAFLPDMPGKKFDKPFKFLGYWHALAYDAKSGLGQVRKAADPNNVLLNEFLAHEFDRYEETCGEGVLPVPWDYVDKTWDANEKLAVLAHLMLGTEFQGWRGHSWCRFGCEAKMHGYRDMTDGVYVWPEGFVHYVEAHNVKPPEEFIRHALRGK
jgi:hypothetical protein